MKSFFFGCRLFKCRNIDALGIKNELGKRRTRWMKGEMRSVEFEIIKFHVDGSIEIVVCKCLLEYSVIFCERLVILCPCAVSWNNWYSDCEHSFYLYKSIELFSSFDIGVAYVYRKVHSWHSW